MKLYSSIAKHLQRSLQMVRLHQDPQGKGIFVLPQGVDNAESDVETLRTRVKELEKMLKDQKSTTVSNVNKQIQQLITMLKLHNYYIIHVYCMLQDDSNHKSPSSTANTAVSTQTHSTE